MNFKEYVMQDVKKTFINLLEFAQPVFINGAEVLVVEDNDELVYKITKNFDGLVIGDLLFYISSEEWSKIPAVLGPSVNQAISYNGKPATITNVVKTEDMYEVIIQYVGGGY